MADHPFADVDVALLHELTSQTEVSEPDHARALLGIARRDEQMAREAHAATRWPLCRARFRMAPVILRTPPLIAALVVTSAIIFALAMALIVLGLAGTVGLFALISMGYTLGFGVILYLLNDRPEEHDQNRATVRRRALDAARDARIASAAKVVRLERETHARAELVDRVIQYGFERDRRRRQEEIRQQREKAKLPIAAAPPPASPESCEPRQPEYGGG